MRATVLAIILAFPITSTAETDSERFERIILHLNVHICARVLVKGIYLGIAKDLSIRPEQIRSLLRYRRTETEARLNMAIDHASEQMAEILWGFFVTNGKDRQDILEGCAKEVRKRKPK